MESNDVSKVKLLQRPGIEKWNQLRLAESNVWDLFWNCSENVERRLARFFSVEEFRMAFENANRPVVVKDAVGHWKAFELMSFSYLAKNFENAEMKCGQTPDGSSCFLDMKTFVEYLFEQSDDFPLYVFDDGFDKTCSELLQLFSVPEYFPEDLFSGVRGRPPHRWLLIGPKRSGSQLHQDPLGTSAWNVSIVGYKLWALFPPDLPKHIVKGFHLTKNRNPDSQEPFFYFHETLKRIEKKFSIKPTIFIQKPGELVFVPSKWWHVVLNLTDTIAITQNFVSRCNFDSVWRMTRRQRKKFFERWKEKLKKSFPDLLERGLRLDVLDDYNSE